MQAGAGDKAPGDKTQGQGADASAADQKAGRESILKSRGSVTGSVVSEFLLLPP